MYQEYELKIFSLSGKVLFQQDNISSDRIWLNCEVLPSGLYIIELRGPQIFKSKIVVE